MLDPHGYENSRPDGFSVLEVIASGEGGHGDGNGPRRFVPLKRTDLRGQVAGPLAALRLTQVFGYTAAECDKVLEAVYRFPLPGDAAVTAVRVQFGEVVIRATLGDRRRAEAGYEAARAKGQQAALASRESAGVFTLQVAGLKPGQDVTIETTFVQRAQPEGPGWSLRVPLTTAPRYVRPDEAGSRPAAGQPLALLRDPGHWFTLDLSLRNADAVQSPTHALDVTREGNTRRVRLQGGEVVPDRDCVVTWRPAADQARPVLDVVVHDDTASPHLYFLALVAPPATKDAGSGLAREVVLLVDHSGSMEGPKWQAADWAVERFLSELTPRDTFALGLFHDTTRWFAPAPRPADPQAIAEAVAFLKTTHDSGGTELGVALEQALGLERSAGAAARHLLVVTDAQVTDEGRVLRLADAEAGRDTRRRVSVLCIDAAPNSALALELAERGGGVARFLTSDPEQLDIATALDEVLADWSEPVLAGLRLEVDRAEVDAAGRRVSDAEQPGWKSIDLGDLPAGRPLWVVGRAVRQAGAGASKALSFRLATGRGQELASCRQELAGEVPEGPALKAIFGARQLIGLEHLMHSYHDVEALGEGLRRLGYDPAQVLQPPPGSETKVYAENARKDAIAGLRELLVREALGFGLACSETAFLAVRTEAGQAVEGTVAVANALPPGWSEGFIGAGGMARSYGGFAGGAGFMATGSLGPPPPMACMAPDSDLDLLSAPIRAAAPASHRTAFHRKASKAAASPSSIVFSAVPELAGGEAVLFDSAQAKNRGGIPDAATLSRLVVRFPGKAPDAQSVDPQLALWIFVDDLTTPRARVRLVDLIQQGGERPLNLRVRPGQTVRISLVDPNGAWAGKHKAPKLELTLGW
jgi:Ca-activated chloride channel family protein